MSPEDGRDAGVHAGTGILVFLGSLLLVALLLEGISRLVIPNRYFVWPPGFEMTFDAGKNITHGVTFPSRLTINAAGMRGDLPREEQQYRILAVGGSTTICVYLDDARAWPFVVQQNVNRALGREAVWVGNVGRPGHRTDHHILQLQKLLAQHPDIDMVMLLVGINDLLANLPGSRPVTTGPPDERQMLVMSFSIFPGWDADTPWYQRNLIGRLIRLSSWRPMPGTEKLQPMDAQGEFVATLRRYRQRAAFFRDQPPDLAEPLAEYAANLNAIIDITRRHDVRVLFVTQPVLWSPDLGEPERKLLWAGGPPFFGLKDGATYLSAGALAASMERYNEVLRAVCRDRDVECLDAAARIEPTGANFYDDAHFTEPGAAALAGLVSDYLLARPPLAP